MAKGIARYAVTFGLSGCYMPDDGPHAYEFTRRRDLVSFVRDEIERLEWPQRVARDVKMRRLWSHIARHGSSVAHFAIQHGANELAFHGLTDAEYREAQKESL